MKTALLTASAACALLCALPAAAYNLGVATPAEFNATLKKAQAGDLIQLAPAFNGPISISDWKIAGVTIRSQSDRAKAVITSLKVNKSNGLTFEALEFAFPATTTAGYGVKVTYSNDIHFRHLDVHGVVDGDPTNDYGGFSIGGGYDVSIESSDLHDLRNGGAFGGSEKVSLIGNELHRIRIDGWDVATSVNVEIASNYVHDFNHLGTVGAGGDHSDAFQFQTARQRFASRDITITGNLIVQGKGAVMQGVFIQDETGTLPYSNVSVTRNLIIGGNWNAIAVGHTIGKIDISGNTVIPLLSMQQRPWMGGPPGVKIGPNDTRAPVDDATAAAIAAAAASALH